MKRSMTAAEKISQITFVRSRLPSSKEVSVQKRTRCQENMTHQSRQLVLNTPTCSSITRPGPSPASTSVHPNPSSASRTPAIPRIPPLTFSAPPTLTARWKSKLVMSTSVGGGFERLYVWRWSLYAFERMTSWSLVPSKLLRGGKSCQWRISQKRSEAVRT